MLQAPYRRHESGQQAGLLVKGKAVLLNHLAPLLLVGGGDADGPPGAIRFFRIVQVLRTRVSWIVTSGTVTRICARYFAIRVSDRK